MSVKKNETPNQLSAADISSISIGATLLVDAQKMEEMEALELSSDFYKKTKTALERKFNNLSEEKRNSLYIQLLAEFIKETFGIEIDLDKHIYNKQLAAKFTGMLAVEDNFNSFTDAIGGGLGIEGEELRKFKKDQVEQNASGLETKKENIEVFDGVHESRAFQNQEIVDSYSEPIRSSILDGKDVDQLPNGEGPFGSLNNPIPVNGKIGVIKYLAKLRNKEGSPVCFHRIGSYSSSATDNPIDMYEVICLFGSKKAELHFDMYHPRRSCVAPEGFQLDRVNPELGAKDQSWGYGVDTLVSDFPKGLIGELKREYGDAVGGKLEKELERAFMVINQGEAVDKYGNKDKNWIIEEMDETLQKVDKKRGELRSANLSVDELVEQARIIEKELDVWLFLAESRKMEHKINVIKSKKAIDKCFIANRYQRDSQLEKAIFNYDKAIEISPSWFLTMQIRDKKSKLLRKLEKFDEEYQELDKICDEYNEEYEERENFIQRYIVLKIFSDACIKLAVFHREAGDNEMSDLTYQALVEAIGVEMKMFQKWIDKY